MNRNIESAPHRRRSQRPRQARHRGPRNRRGDRDRVRNERGGAATNVDEATQATYLPRLFLHQYASGIVRTFDYELFDEGGPPFGAYGLVHADVSPKPAYTALANLLALFADSSSPSAGAPVRSLTFALDAPGAEVRHALFAKRDGEMILALWLPGKRVRYALASSEEHCSRRNVALRFPHAPRSLTSYQYDAAGRLHASSPAVAPTLRLSVTERVSLLVLEPSAPR